MTRQYLAACRQILEYGTRKPNRTGVDTISTFGVHMMHDLRQGFPLLTTKDVNWFHISAELLWFLSGRTDIGFLKRHGIKFWDAWADESGRVPSAYGNFWRHFPVHGTRGGPLLHTEFCGTEYRGCAPHCPSEIARNAGRPEPRLIERTCSLNDQIAWAVEELRRNPMSRRVVVSAWAPENAQNSKLPPCHVMFALNVQNLLPPAESPSGELEPHLCLHLTQRSCDMFLGVPYNIASYALLLSLIAKLTGLKAGLFSHTLVDAHFYTSKPDGSFAGPGSHLLSGGADDRLLDHVPLIRTQLDREPRKLPRLVIRDDIKELSDLDRLAAEDLTTVQQRDNIRDAFRLMGYDPHPAIRGRAAV